MRRCARVGWAVAIAIWAAIGLSACGGGDGAGSSAAATSLPQVTASDPQTAKQFIQRWAAADARMENTGRTAAYLALTRECQLCRSLAHNIARRYAAGGYIKGGGLRIDSIEVPPYSGAVVLYTVHAHSAPMTIRDSAASREQHFPGRRVTYLVGVDSGSRPRSITSVTSG